MREVEEFHPDERDVHAIPEQRPGLERSEWIANEERRIDEAARRGPWEPLKRDMQRVFS
ncbi:MAG: hypothetical protein GX614_00345 [Sandaracinaceae bacterium]|nr:hypothetical protein [Sandaracinaceae bacterium]